MKHTMLYITIGLSLISTVAHADPKISGKLRMELLHESQKIESTRLSNGAVSNSKDSGRTNLYAPGEIKFSATQKIDDTWTTRYSLTYLTDLDGDGGKNFRPGTTYISLEHKDYGRMRFGRMTTPEDEVVDVAVSYSGLMGAGKPFTNSGFRSNNAIQYYSPYFMHSKDGSRTRVKLHYGMDENTEDTNIRAYTKDSPYRRQDVKRDAAVAQIMRTGGKVEWGASYTHAGDELKAISGMVAYNGVDWRVAASARKADYGTADDETGFFISGVYQPAKDWNVYGQVGHVENYAGQGFGVRSTDYTVGAIGVSKDFRVSNGRATAYVETAIEKLKFLQPNSRQTRLSTYENEEIIGLAAGVEYRF
ncbi:MAG: porin [Moraxella sp.]|nr:porin [Moraxella sp.]